MIASAKIYSKKEENKKYRHNPRTNDKTKLYRQNHKKRHTHTHSQKEKSIYIYLYIKKKEESN